MNIGHLPCITVNLGADYLDLTSIQVQRPGSHTIDNVYKDTIIQVESSSVDVSRIYDGVYSSSKSISSTGWKNVWNSDWDNTFGQVWNMLCVVMIGDDAIIWCMMP